MKSLQYITLSRPDHPFLNEAEEQAHHRFPFRVPLSLWKRVDWAEEEDPLVRQWRPGGEELRDVEGFDLDPLGEEGSKTVPGLLAKYPGRVLMLLSAQCAVHCRFCFRRHGLGPIPTTREGWRGTLNWIRERSFLKEIIWSGGDPLMLADEELAWMAGELGAMPHLQRLRIHTRMPLVSPERVGASLLDWLKGIRLQPWLVVHCNHAGELMGGGEQALRRLVREGIPVLSQSVLLRGVNDSLEVLEELFNRLVDCGVRPYYLHLLDRVAGTAHFEVGQEEGQSLLAGLRARLPGYAVPLLAREEQGLSAKRIIF
ncbi:MAG: KamA family radical SAM protein [Magnetococcales bacterium]|nr:KamA family radical SAM protein [Magnetococcales bacterium]